MTWSGRAPQPARRTRCASTREPTARAERPPPRAPQTLPHPCRRRAQHSTHARAERANRSAARAVSRPPPVHAPRPWSQAGAAGPPSTRARRSGSPCSR